MKTQSTLKTTLRWLTAMSFAAIAGVSGNPVQAAPPDKADKPPSVHWWRTMPVPLPPGRAGIYVAGPFESTSAVEISAIHVTNFGDDPIALQLGASVPNSEPVGSRPGDPAYPPDFCTELSEGRSFGVFDEVARFVVPGNSSHSLSIPNATNIPGAYSPFTGEVIMPNDRWCIVMFYPVAVYPLPALDQLVDIHLYGKVEVAGDEP